MGLAIYTHITVTYTNCSEITAELNEQKRSDWQCHVHETNIANDLLKNYFYNHCHLPMLRQNKPVYQISKGYINFELT